MRTKIDTRIDVEADLAQVMDALLAVEMLPEWSVSYHDVRIASRDESRRPVRVFVKTDYVNNESDMQVLQYSWGENRVAWEITDSTRGVKGGGFFEVTPTDTGCSVLYHTDIYLPLPVPGFLVKRAVRKADQETARNFVAFAEQFPEHKSFHAV